jgi:hypothetical protein
MNRQNFSKKNQKKSKKKRIFSLKKSFFSLIFFDFSLKNFGDSFFFGMFASQLKKESYESSIFLCFIFGDIFC